MGKREKIAEGTAKYLLRERLEKARRARESQARMDKSSEDLSMGRLENPQRTDSFRAAPQEPSLGKAKLQQLQRRFSEVEARNPEGSYEYNQDRSAYPGTGLGARHGGENAAHRRQLRRIAHAYGDTAFDTPELNVQRWTGIKGAGVPGHLQMQSDPRLRSEYGPQGSEEEEELSILDQLLKKYRGLM